MNANIVRPEPQNLRGVDVVGGSTSRPVGEAAAVVVRPLGVFHSPAIKWKEGIALRDGAADVGIALGTTMANAAPNLPPVNGTGSMSLEFLSRDVGGTERASQMYTDPSGNLLLTTAWQPALSILANQKVKVESGITDGRGPNTNAYRLVM